MPQHVNIEFKEIINKMLKKDPIDRPLIEEIIYSDMFQNKA
jgi:hypothetical protein